MHYFTKDTYRTPEGSRVIWDKLMLNSRFYFLYKFFGIVLRSRKLAINNKYDTEAWVGSSQDTFKNLEACGGIFNIEGVEHFANEKGPFVFASNHMSILETLIFPGLITPFGDLSFVAKSSLTHYPFFGKIFKARNPIVVGRENSREDLMTVLNEGKKHLANNHSILLFPQSTRRSHIDPDDFNSLAVKLAKKAGVKVIPVAIKTDFWVNGKFIKELGPLDRSKEIFFSFGKPIEINGNGKEEHKYIIEFIKTRFDQWSKK